LSSLTASQAVATDASKNLVSVATTGTGSYVLATSPTLVTPEIGAATGTGLLLTGLTASSALATDASKNLVSVATTGTGSYVLATSPTLVTPEIGAATGTGLLLTGLTASYALATDASKNLVSVATTGSGDYVLATSPALITPSLGVATGTSVALTGDLTLAGSTSGIVSVKTQAIAGTFNFNLPVTAGSTGQVLASAGGSSSPMTWKTVLSTSQLSYGGTQSAVNADITGLLYTASSFETNIVADIVATANLTQIFKLSGVNSGGASGWNLTAVGISGDNASVTFTITSGGQIKYSSGTYAGFVSLNFTWSDYINAAGLVNLSTGVNTSTSISATTGQLFNVSGATVTDNVTAASGTLAVFRSTYIGQPTIAAVNTSVTTSKASTVYIAGEPIAGSNQTITVKHALRIGNGGKLGLDGSASGTVSLTTQAAAGTFNFNLPVTAGTSGQVLVSAGGASAPMTWANVTTSPISSGSFSGADNQAAAADVTDLVFASGHFSLDIVVTVTATTSLVEFFKVHGVYNAATTTWYLTSISVAGNNSLVAFTINGSGQVQYTGATYAGFTSMNIAWA
jgi:hypothetical protein